MSSFQEKRTEPPTNSYWYREYIDNPVRDVTEFRNDFRLPYEAFLELKDELLKHDEFKRWAPGVTDPFGTPCSPIELLLLGSLRYLAHG